jgi:hypothetical protein
MAAFPFEVEGVELVPATDVAGGYEVPKYWLRLHLWTGVVLEDTYGGKPVVEVDGEPLFAELAILRLLEADGWDGVWVDTYRRVFRRGLPGAPAAELPRQQRETFNAIVAENGGTRGCWDVFAWRGDVKVFAEAKRRGRDRVRRNQGCWLDSAVRAGVPVGAFAVVEWDLDSGD